MRSSLPWMRSSSSRRMRSGKNTHHILEASVKAFARALRDAVRLESDQMPSTKGVL